MWWSIWYLRQTLGDCFLGKQSNSRGRKLIIINNHYKKEIDFEDKEIILGIQGNIRVIFLWRLKNILCCWNILWWAAFHWSMVSSSAYTHWIKLSLPLLADNNYLLIHDEGRVVWPPSLTILGPVWHGLRQALCMVSECVFTCACCLAESMRQCFLHSSTASSPYTLPAPYFGTVPETWETGIVYVFLLGLSILFFFHILNFSLFFQRSTYI